jgi:DNA-binding MarR family transcriptional regulator
MVPLMLHRIHVDTMLSLRKAYKILLQRYASVSSTSEFNGYEVLILMSAFDPTSAKGLAELLSCKPAQITGYVSRLESLGFLKRKISKEDKRSFNFQLTKSGKQKADDLLMVTQDIFDSSTNLSQQENTTLVSLLEKV